MAAPKHALVPSPDELSLSDQRLISDKYRIDGFIAEGGMGVVYKARHLDLDQPVAIKVVRPDLAHSELVIARFLNEARAAARLRGVHVARVLDAGRLADGMPYLVMEYLEGADLCAVLTREGPLPVGVAVDYLLQACQAVAEAHAAGIIHRDLKPENLFLTSDADGAPMVKVLDFGISKQLAAGARALTNPSCGVGSPHYMSPEQMRSPDSVDQRADVWSLGAVLYELLTGSPPFDGDNLAVICAHVLGGEPTPLRELRSDVPPELENAIFKALEKDRRSRYASVTEFARALERFRHCSETPSAHSRDSLPVDSQPHARPKPSSGERAVPVCSVRVRARSDSDATPPPRVDSIEIPGLRRSRAPLVAAVIASAALAGYVSARWSDVGNHAIALGHRLEAMKPYVEAMKTYAVELSVPAFANMGGARPAGRSSAIPAQLPPATIPSVEDRADGAPPTNRGSSLRTFKTGAAVTPTPRASGSDHGAD